MSNSCLCIDHIGTRSCDGGVIIIHHKITPHACRQVDQYIPTTVPNPLHRIFKQVDVTAADTRFWVAYVDMDDRGPGIRRLDCRVSNLFRRDRHVGVLANRISCSCHRTGDDHFSVHLHGVLLSTAFSSAPLTTLIFASLFWAHLRPAILPGWVPVFLQYFLDFRQTLIPPSFQFIEISIARFDLAALHDPVLEFLSQLGGLHV